MGAGESRQPQHGGIGTRWRRATGEQMAAGRPGNAPPTPARPGDRGRARGVRCSGSSARQLAERVAVGSPERFHKARRACAKQLHPAKYADVLCHIVVELPGNIRFLPSSTTRRCQRRRVLAKRRSGPTGGRAADPGLKLGAGPSSGGPVSYREGTAEKLAGLAEREVLPLCTSRVLAATRFKSGGFSLP